MLVEVGLHLATVGKLAATARVADFLCVLHQALEVRGEPALSVNLPMSRTDIGDYLGMRLETVSRALTSLRRQRLIEAYSDTVVIVDLAGLKLAASRV